MLRRWRPGVGPGAQLRLSGVAATLALPGARAAESLSAVDIEVGEAGVLEYLPEPAVVTARARHTAELVVSLARGARLHTREVLVLGRTGERSGSLRTTQRVVREGVPLLHQTLTTGDPALEDSLAYLAGRRVVATEILVWGEDPARPVSGDWWSLTPLAAGGLLITSLATEAVTARRGLSYARELHPGWTLNPGAVLA